MDSHLVAVGRRTVRIFAAVGENTKEALGSSYPRAIRRDSGPINKKKAVQSLVAYLKELRGVSIRVKSYEKGLMVVYLVDIKVTVQVNCRKQEAFNENTVVIRIDGYDIENVKLSRAAGTLILDKIWQSAPVTERIALAKKNGLV